MHPLAGGMLFLLTCLVIGVRYGIQRVLIHIGLATLLLCFVITISKFI